MSEPPAPFRVKPRFDAIQAVPVARFAPIPRIAEVPPLDRAAQAAFAEGHAGGVLRAAPGFGR